MYTGSKNNYYFQFTMSKNIILELYKSQKTVFTISEIALIWEEKNPKNTRAKIKYYVDNGDLIRLRRGIYGKSNYDRLELATKIYTPAYISFETVSRREGMTFQYYETVFVASYLSREIKLKNSQKIQYWKLKDEILLNPQGIIQKENYSIASKERAFMDMIYLRPHYYFDNLNSLDWEKCFALLDVYENKNMRNILKDYQKKYAQQ